MLPGPGVSTVIYFFNSPSLGKGWAWVDLQIDLLIIKDTGVKKVMTEPNQSLFARLKAGLSKTKSGFVQNIEGIFAASKKIDEELFTDLEDSLIMADVGMRLTATLINRLRKIAKERALSEPSQLKEALDSRKFKVF